MGHVKNQYGFVSKRVMFQFILAQNGPLSLALFALMAASGDDKQRGWCTSWSVGGGGTGTGDAGGNMVVGGTCLF